MNIMGLSIQDYLKKINSWLTITDIASIFVTFLVIVLFTGYIWNVKLQAKREVVYQENTLSETVSVNQVSEESRPFGSRKGKTYTFGWCSGSGTIKASNKIYFASPKEAEAQGRTLSKLCKR